MSVGGWKLRRDCTVGPVTFRRMDCSVTKARAVVRVDYLITCGGSVCGGGRGGAESEGRIESCIGVCDCVPIHTHHMLTVLLSTLLSISASPTCLSPTRCLPTLPPPDGRQGLGCADDAGVARAPGRVDGVVSDGAVHRAGRDERAGGAEPHFHPKAADAGGCCALLVHCWCEVVAVFVFGAVLGLYWVGAVGMCCGAVVLPWWWAHWWSSVRSDAGAAVLAAAVSV